MKATANREGLLTAFSVVSGVVPARSPKPILSNVKLELEDEIATLMATDLDVGIRYQVSGLVVEKPGDAILPTSEMSAILRELPDERLDIESADNRTRVAGASSKFELAGEDPLLFPDVPRFAEGDAQVIKAGVLATMIRRTLFAIASENTRYHFNSVLLEFDEGEARMVATDGKRLAFMPGALIRGGAGPDGLTLVPPKVLNLLSKVLLDPEEEISLAVRENEILFRASKATLYSRLTDGRFPHYQDVFPDSPKITVSLTVGPFLQVVRQAKIVTREDSKGVDFAFDEGALTLSSRGSQVGESEVRMPIGYDGPSITVTFDPQLLIDALKVLEPEEEITLEMIDERKATVMRAKDRYAYVVMPLTRER